MAKLGSSTTVVLCLALAASANCIGTIGDDAKEGETVDPTVVPRGAVRRLSAAEYSVTLRDLLADVNLPVFETLPIDPRTPFDNDTGTQVASQALIDAADFLAQQAVENLLADPLRRDQVVGCTPAGPDDQECMRSFVASFGRRALRRALAQDEIAEFTTRALEFSVEAGDFYIGVDMVIWALLQDPEFLYRPEIGTEVQPGVFELSDFEVASRLSYFIWGSMPSDALLDRAARGELSTAEHRRDAAREMLEDDRAKNRIARFHAMWLGYEMLPHQGELGADMRAETKALVERVIFEDARPWQDLFRFEETFVTDLLANHYGLALPADPSGGWVSYADSGRAGLLSHGSYLSIGAKFNDTSPVQRGLAIREQLLCQSIADPPPNVNVDAPVVAENAICKPERFAAHSQGGCATCHRQIDPLGFGLEAYDQFGAFRTHEPDIPDTPEDETQCEIEGRGNIDGAEFSGPAELGKLAVESGMVSDCLTQQLYRLVLGRSELGTVDKRVVRLMQEQMGEGDFSFVDLAVAIVSHPSFAYRREE